MMESASRWIEKTDFIGGQWTNVYIRADTGDALPVTELRSQEVTNSAAFSQDIVQSATAPRNPRIVTAPVIRIAGNAVLAEGSEYTVRFASNARTVGAIELRRNGSPPLRSSVLGLAYYEGERSVMIADLKPSAAQVLEGGRVFYSDAFDGDFGMVADIVYTCAARSFEQDVVIRTKLPSPTLYGMSKNASLCVITEFYDTPKPAAREQVLDLSEWNSWLGTDAEPMVDEILGFGKLQMRMIPGKAFSLENRELEVPVRKQFRALDTSGRRFLLESTPYKLIRKLEQNLPEPQASLEIRPTRQVENALLAPKPLDESAQSMTAQFALNSKLPAPGVVIDYILVTSPMLNVNFGDPAPEYQKSGPAAVGQSIGDFWNLSNTKFNQGTVTFTNLWWSDSSGRSTADLAVQNAPGLWGNGVLDDIMYHHYVYSWNAQPVFATLSQVPEDVYDLYVYGHSPGDTGNGLFKLRRNGVLIGHRGTTVWGHDWASTNWTEGEQYVVFRDIYLTPSDTLQIEVVPVNTYPILAGLQLVPSGAISEPDPQIQRLINIDTAGTQGAKTGPAAIGLGSTDFWNLYHKPGVNNGVLQDLLYSDLTPSGAGLKVQFAAGHWSFATPPAPIDPMYDGYIYRPNPGSSLVMVTNLPNGIYDFYLYSHEGVTDGNSVISLTCGGASLGPRGTTIWGDGWASANWQEGQQYLVFRNVLVVNSNTVTLTISPSVRPYPVLNGMQIVQRTEDLDDDQLPDWWELTHFGDLSQFGDLDPQGYLADYDQDGISNLVEYQNGTDPNTIRFQTQFATLHITNRTVNGSLVVQSGVPAHMVVLVNETNLTGVTWLPYNSSFSATVPNLDGPHTVLVAVRGRTSDFPPTEDETEFILDRVPPVLVITNPAVATVTRPYLQLQGYANEPLVSLQYNLTNAAGVLINEAAFVVDQYFDTNQFDFTTNFFQAYDVELTNNLNTISLTVCDRAGNITTTNVSVTLDFTSDSDPPVLEVIWPPDGAQLSGDSFYIRGRIDDETATVKAQVTDSADVTHEFPGIVERNGIFWIENLPLVDDTMEVTLVAEDAAGNTNVTSLSVVGSSVILTILSAPDGESLYSPSGVVYGTVSDPGYNSVRVNGVEADVDEYGFWYANDVPIYGRGTATFDVEASQEGGGTLMTAMGMAASGAGGGPVLASVQAEMPAHIEIVEHESSKSASYSFEGGGYANNSRTKSYRAEAQPGPGGAWQATFHGTATDFSDDPNGWNKAVYDWTPTSRTTQRSDHNGSYPPSDVIEESHQEVTCVPDKSLRELGWVGGSGGVGAYPPEWVHHYHARGVKYKWPDGYGGRITASVSARTQMKLYTGGKAGIKGRSLIHIEANAEQYGQPPNGPWLHTPKNNIDPTKIYVLGWWLFGRHALDPTGDLYLAMPDNAVKDLNLRVPGVKHYGAWASATKLRLALNSVTFSGMPDAILRDDGTGPYAAPHWTTNETTGTVTSHPVLYVSGSKVQTSTDFKLIGNTSIPLIVKGKVSGGGTSFTLWGTNDGPQGPLCSFDMYADPSLAANKVDFYNPMTIKWQYSSKSKLDFLDAGVSTNQVYVSLGAAQTANLYHTVVHLACSRPGATTPNQAVDNTWALFEGPANVTTWDGRALHYYRQGFAICPTRLPELLASDDGNCNAWAELLCASLQVNGVNSARTTVLSAPEFGVKNLSFTEPPTFPINFAPYNYSRPLMTPTGIPGQNTPTPAEKLFGVHWIVHPSIAGSVYYDPSYGVKAATATAYTGAAIGGWRANDPYLDRWTKPSSDPSRTLTFSDGPWP